MRFLVTSVVGLFTWVVVSYITLAFNSLLHFSPIPFHSLPFPPIPFHSLPRMISTFNGLSRIGLNDLPSHWKFVHFFGFALADFCLSFFLLFFLLSSFFFLLSSPSFPFSFSIFRNICQRKRSQEIDACISSFHFRGIVAAPPPASSSSSSSHPSKSHAHPIRISFSLSLVASDGSNAIPVNQEEFRPMSGSEERRRMASGSGSSLWACHSSNRLNRYT